MITRRHFTQGAVAALAGTSFGRPASARAGTLRIIVGFSAGGAVDVAARATADALRKSMDTSVIVENKSGAAGGIAVQAVSRANDGGGTLLFCPSSILTLRPYVDNAAGADAQDSLTPVSPVCEYSFALTVGPGTSARTLDEFIAWCKAHPEKASFGSPGHATAPHVVGAMFARDSATPLVHVPYRGGAQAIGDLLGGQLPAMVTTLPVAIPLHRSGKLRILASTGTARLPLLPDVPTFSEHGFKAMQIHEWFGFFAPRATAASTVEALNRAVHAAIAEPGTRAVLERGQYELRSASVAEFAAMMREDTQRWRAIVERLDIRPAA